MLLLIKLFFAWFPWISLFAISYGLIRADIFSDDLEGYLRIAMWVSAGVILLTILSLIFKPIRWLLGLIFGLGCLVTPFAGKKAANYCKAKESPSGD